MKVWITSKEKEIPIDQLKTGHLLNILAMLKRNAEPVLTALGFEVSSETLGQCYELWSALENEAMARIEAIKKGWNEPELDRDAFVNLLGLRPTFVFKRGGRK